MDDVAGRLAAVISIDAVFARAATELVPNLLAGLLVFDGFCGFWRVAVRVLASVTKKAAPDETAARFTQALVKYTAMTIGVVTTGSQ